MKKIVSLLALSFIILSCSKKSDDKNNQVSSYFRMKVDGQLKEYDSCWISSFQQPAGSQTYYQWNIKAGKPGDYGGVYVNDNMPISAKTYSSSILNTASNTPAGGIGAYRPAGTNDIYISYQANWPLYDATVTITSIDDRYVIGTFSGKMRLVGGSESDVKNITEGEFKALK